MSQPTRQDIFQTAASLHYRGGQIVNRIWDPALEGTSSEWIHKLTFVQEILMIIAELEAAYEEGHITGKEALDEMLQLSNMLTKLRIFWFYN